DFDYPGNVSERFGGFSDRWWDELQRLDELAKDERHNEAIHDDMAQICCNVLVKCVIEGVIADWRSLDLNVATLLDSIETIQARDASMRVQIRELTR
ncbi:MAG: hypothetical protein KDA42_05635, partial [Planctomycetales bacterium]|nr:hypothetical protein [Planctomycetales bacterium]